MRISILLTLFFFALSAHSQKLEFTYLLIPDTLKTNSNAVVRFDKIDIIIESQRSMLINRRRIVTVLNEQGITAIDAAEHYDKKQLVKSIEATVYDAVGNEIKKIKRKDFRDHAVIDNATMFSDSRVMYLDYTPIQYPFTIVYESSVATPNTAFIPQWLPLDSYFVSIENAELNVFVDQSLGFRKREFNFAGFNVSPVSRTTTGIKYVAKNIPAQKPEPYSPTIPNIFPRVMMALDKFHLEGVDGDGTTWTEFGKWFNDKILRGTTELPQETKHKMIQLVGNETDPIKKARIIYDFVQQKSRYVSIQEGIGGWKPMPAEDVDRLGYGDCKALTNYTLALLQAVGVEAYYTRLWAGSEKRDVVRDFVAMQSNHVILAIPQGSGYIFLECTSQIDPFGYQGTFTDDRDVLIMKPDGAEIARTTSYGDAANKQISIGKYSILANGDLTGSIAIASEGTQYSKKFNLERLPPSDRDSHYKSYWNTVGNLMLKDVAFKNDKNNIRFTENAKIEAADYGKLSGNRMLVVVNAFNRLSGNLKRIKDRKTAFEVDRGFYDSDEIEIAIPDGFSIEALPSPIQLQTNFGEYKTEVVIKSDTLLLYKRTLLLKTGTYDKSEYEDFRKFWDQISRNDYAKMVLLKT